MLENRIKCDKCQQTKSCDCITLISLGRNRYAIQCFVCLLFSLHERGHHALYCCIVDFFFYWSDISIDRFSVLSTNNQSINSKFNELEAFVEELGNNDFKFSVINVCLKETWKSDCDDLSVYDLHGYKCIAQDKHCSNKGGLMIYVHNKYKAEVKCNINMYEHWEGLIIEIKDGCLSKTIIIGNIYRHPKTTNANLNVFIEALSYTLSSLENNNNQIILAGGLI